MFTVLLYEMNLHMDGGSTSTRPPKSQLIVYMSLPDFLLPSVFRIYFFSNAIKINHVIIIDLKIISVIDFINSTIRKNQMPKPRKGKEVRQVRLLTDSLVTKSLWNHLSVNILNKPNSLQAQVKSITTKENKYTMQFSYFCIYIQIISQLEI